MFEWILIVLLFVFMAIAASLIIWSIRNGISPMPSTSKASSALFSLLPSEFKGKIYELGSGWGTLVIPLAKKYPDCQIIGFETSPVPFWFSKLWLKIRGTPNAVLVRKDFFSVNLNEASLVVCYLYPGAMEVLKGKFETELKPGALVASNTFAIRGWIPEKVIELDDLYHTKIYLYKISRIKD